MVEKGKEIKVADSIKLNVFFILFRFTSSAYEQWMKIYSSYVALIKAYFKNCEDEKDRDDETRYQIRGQDYAIDLCGVLDVLKPATTLMVKCQALSVAPWKIVLWFERLVHGLKQMEKELISLRDGEKDVPNEKNLPTLSKHWTELTQPDIEECTFQGTQVLEGWLVMNEDRTSTLEAGKRKKKK